MSDYIFKPRLEFRAADYNKVYYSDPINPYTQKSNPNTWLQEIYVWGRWWELLDYYKQDPTTDYPDKLGFIEEAISVYNPVYIYLRSKFWVDAPLFDGYFPDGSTGDVSYNNMDGYSRTISKLLGNINTFVEQNSSPIETRDYITGVIEKRYGSNIGSQAVYDMSTFINGVFTIIRVQNNMFIYNGVTYEFFNGILFPYQDTMNVIGGHPLYWNLPLWYLKRYLMIKKGVEF